MGIVAGGGLVAALAAVERVVVGGHGGGIGSQGRGILIVLLLLLLLLLKLGDLWQRIVVLILYHCLFRLCIFFLDAADTLLPKHLLQGANVFDGVSQSVDFARSEERRVG